MKLCPVASGRKVRALSFFFALGLASGCAQLRLHVPGLLPETEVQGGTARSAAGRGDQNSASQNNGAIATASPLSRRPPGRFSSPGRKRGSDIILRPRPKR